MQEFEDSQRKHSLDSLLHVDRICDAFEAAWSETSTPELETFLRQLPNSVRLVGLRELLAVEIEQRWSRGEAISAEELVERFPRCEPFIDALLSQFAAGTEIRSGTKPFRLLGEQPREMEANEPPPKSIGRYQITGVLGAGGFGRVYRALDSHLGREVAIKGPSPEYWKRLHAKRRPEFDERAAQRIVDEFLEEARKVAGLTHPGLVTIYEFLVEEGRPFIVQELIHGQNLLQWVHQRQSDARMIAQLLLQVAEVLQYAHEQDLIHRDLKPSNVLVDDEGRVYVMDFGLALHESVQLQRPGDGSGTPEYMSPEQVRGESHRMDGRSDLWSFGVIFYELLVGRRPCCRDSPIPFARCTSKRPGTKPKVACWQDYRKRARTYPPIFRSPKPSPGSAADRLTRLRRRSC
jgi:hypothetical protein